MLRKRVIYDACDRKTLCVVYDRLRRITSYWCWANFSPFFLYEMPLILKTVRYTSIKDMFKGKWQREIHARLIVSGEKREYLEETKSWLHECLLDICRFKLEHYNFNFLLCDRLSDLELWMFMFCFVLLMETVAGQLCDFQTSCWSCVSTSGCM